MTLTQREGGLGYHPSSHPTTAPGAKVFFANSGTEANEGALKVARKVAKERWRAAGKEGECAQFRVVSFANAFHGRSMGALRYVCFCAPVVFRRRPLARGQK